MSHVTIKRYERDVAVTLYSTTALASTLRMNDMAGGLVSLATMSSSAATLQMWGSNAEDGSFRRIYKTDGSAADITLAGAAGSAAGLIYSLPDEVFATTFLKIVLASTAATGTIGLVMLKS